MRSGWSRASVSHGLFEAARGRRASALHRGPPWVCSDQNYVTCEARVCVALVAIAGRGYTYTVCTHRNYLLTSHRSRLHAQGTLPSERTPDLFLFSRLIFRQKVNRRRGLAADFGLDDVPPRGHSRSRRRHVGAVLHFGLLGHAIGHNIDQRFRFWRLGNL